MLIQSGSFSCSYCWFYEHCCYKKDRNQSSEKGTCVCGVGGWEKQCAQLTACGESVEAILSVDYCDGDGIELNEVRGWGS